ncbi:hypothetical protein AYO44_02335 [Planctomycetaceae bacterium SCGC AG-212-F19]|nr:hypothetical protein AYO44_02335 [Planctomycetaceae bacterium SCGC AG-212-F19]
MKPLLRNPWCWLGAAFIGLAGICCSFLVPAVRYPIIGWVHGESFYKGWPTSYWRDEVADLYRPPAAQPSIWIAPWQLVMRTRPRRLPESTRLFGAVVAEPAATGVLVELTRDENPHVALYAIGELVTMQPPGNERVPALIDLLRHPAIECRRTAAQIMLNICAGGPAVVSALTRALDEDDLIINANAASALGVNGPLAKEAVPALLRILRSPQAKERPFPMWDDGIGDMTLGDFVAEALKRIDPDTAAWEGID